MPAGSKWRKLKSTCWIMSALAEISETECILKTRLLCGPIKIILISEEFSGASQNIKPIRNCLNIMFHNYIVTTLLCSQTPDEPWLLPYRAFGSGPDLLTAKKTIVIHLFEALSHGFCNHCLRFLQVFLLTTQYSFPG